MTITPADLVSTVIDPICDDLAAHAGVPYPLPARTLLLATAAQETQLGTYLIQHTNSGTGAAVGVYQMEHATITDLWTNFISPSARFKPVIDKYTAPGAEWPEQLCWNLAAATIFARLFYYRVPAPLPSNDALSIWAYYKQHWNTPLGAATEAQFMQNFRLLGSYAP